MPTWLAWKFPAGEQPIVPTVWVTLFPDPRWGRQQNAHYGGVPAQLGQEPGVAPGDQFPEPGDPAHARNSWGESVGACSGV